MLLDRFRVQPAEKRRFTIDYAPRLNNGNLLTTVETVTVEPVTVPPFLASVGVDSTKSVLVVYTEGGVDTEDYKVEILVNTIDIGQVWEDEIQFVCEDT